MKLKITCSLCFLALLFIGCSYEREVTPRASVDQYLIAMLNKYSGRLYDVPEEQSLTNAAWTSEEDSQGVKVFINGNRFDQIDRFFRSVCGDPYDVSTNKFGGGSNLYHVRDVGAAIWYNYFPDLPGHGETTTIIILRPQHF